MRNRIVVGTLFCLFVVTILFFVLDSQDNENDVDRVLVGVKQGKVKVHNENTVEEVKSGEEVAIDKNHRIKQINNDKDKIIYNNPVKSKNVLSSTSENQSSPTDRIHSSTAASDFWITGFVKTTQGVSIPGSHISAKNATSSSDILAETQSNHKGYYTLAFDKPGQYLLESHLSDKVETESIQINLDDRTPIKEHDFIHDVGSGVRGRVINRQNKSPIAGANVILLPQKGKVDANQKEINITTNKNGQFFIPGLAMGTYGLVARAKGYFPRELRNSYVRNNPFESVYINEQTINNEIVVEMDPGLAALIRVSDPQGSPVAGAKIKLGMRESYTKIEGQTDKKGEWLCDQLADAISLAVVEKEPHGVSVSDTFKPGPIDQPPIVNIQLKPAATVKGKVTYKKGLLSYFEDEKPAVDYRVKIFNLLTGQRLDGMSKGMWSADTQTNENGQFTFEGVGEGPHGIIVIAKTYHIGPLASTDVQLTAGETKSNVHLKIEQEEEGTSKLKGKVKNKQGEPIARAKVHANSIKHAWGSEKLVQINSGYTNEEGEFHLTKFKEAELVKIWVSAEGYNEAYKEAELDTYVEITLKSAGTIQGFVVDKQSGEGIPNAEVLLQHPSHYYKPPEITRTDQEGHFKIENVAGSFQLVVNANGYAQNKEQQIQIKAEETVSDIVIELEPGGELRGIVLGNNQQPLARASIGLLSKVDLIYQNEETPFRSVTIPDTVLTDNNGEFHLNTIPPHGDVLLISHNNYAPNQFRVSPEMIGQDLVTIQLTNGGRIEGVVVDTRQKPIKDVKISAFNFPQNLYFYQTTTGQDGHYQISHLPPIQFTVMKKGSRDNKNQRAFKQVTVVEDGIARADFGLESRSNLSGTVYRQNKPIGNARIALMPESGSIGFNFQTTTTSKEDGTYRIEGIPSGRYLLFVTTLETSGSSATAIAVENQGMTAIQIGDEKNEYHQDLHLSEYEINGVVFDNATQAPLNGAQIEPAMQTDKPISYGSIYLRTESDDNGEFTLHPPAAGQYAFAVKKDGYHDHTFTITVNNEQNSETTFIKVPLENTTTQIRLVLTHKGQSLNAPYIRGVAIQNGLARQITQMQENQSNIFTLDSLNKGKADLVLFSKVGESEYMSTPLSFQVNEGQSQTIQVPMLESVNTLIELQTNNNRAIEGNILIQADGFPQFSQIPISLFLRGNVLRMPIPRIVQNLKIKVPGYQTTTLSINPQQPDNHNMIHKVVNLREE